MRLKLVMLFARKMNVSKPFFRSLHKQSFQINSNLTPSPDLHTRPAHRNPVRTKECLKNLQLAPNQRDLITLIIRRRVDRPIRITVEPQVGPFLPQSMSIRIRRGNTEESKRGDVHGELEAEEGVHDILADAVGACEIHFGGG